MILALESSCDETAVALFDPGRGIVAEALRSQVALHARHGGVVPDLATREHLAAFGPLLAGLADPAGAAGPGLGRVSAVAVTEGPGLAACLAVGIAAARALGLALRVPVRGVNHLRAHAWSPFMPLHVRDPAGFERGLEPLLPHLGLLVSGGNTLLFSLGVDRAITVLASTRDDAAGEALDKGAKLLGLPYPGGPAVEARARAGRPGAYDFPRGLEGKGTLDFSFSGLKTSLRYRIERMGPAAVEAAMADLCAGYQGAVVDVLASRVGDALGAGSYRSVGLSGGVANNGPVRAAVAATAARHGVPLLAAEPRHTGDNAAMVGFAAWVDPLVSAGGSGCVPVPVPSALLAPG